MEQYSGRFDTGGQKWFDWWRIVTGGLMVPFLAGSVEYFSHVDDDASLAVGFAIIGLYLLAVAVCFGTATLLRSGGSGRRVFTTIGVTLVLLAVIVVLLAISAYQSGDIDHEESSFTYDLGYTAACLMTPGDGAAPGAAGPILMTGLDPGWGAL